MPMSQSNHASGHHQNNFISTGLASENKEVCGGVCLGGGVRLGGAICLGGGVRLGGSVCLGGDDNAWVEPYAWVEVYT